MSVTEVELHAVRDARDERLATPHAEVEIDCRTVAAGAALHARGVLVYEHASEQAEREARAQTKLRK